MMERFGSFAMASAIAAQKISRSSSRTRRIDAVFGDDASQKG